MRNNWFLLLAAACALGATTDIQAQNVINVDFNRTATSTTQAGLAAAPDAAGAAAVWNVTVGTIPGDAVAGTPGVADLLDSAGSTTSVALTIDARGVYNTLEGDNEQQSGHVDLFDDYMTSRNNSNQEDLRTGSWSGLVPGNAYDLYFYGQGDNFSGDGSFNSGQNVGVRIGTDVRHTSFDGVGRQVDGAGAVIPGGSGDGSLVEDVEYVVFRGIVADASGAISFEHFNPGQGLHGTDSTFFDSDTGLADADNDPSRFHALNGVQIVGDFGGAAPLKGDVDLSGAVDFLDIGPFIGVLSAGTFQAEADVDCSGAVDFLDIGPFVTLLSGP